MNYRLFKVLLLLGIFFTRYSFSEENSKNLDTSLEMKWERKEGTFSFKSWQNKYAFEIILTRDQYKKIPKKIQPKFWYKEQKYFFSYHNDGWKEPPYHNTNESYELAKKRIVKDAHPAETMPLVELAHLIESKKVIFYTGAGLSEAAGIPTMDQLEVLFELDAQGKWIADAIQTPEKILEKVRFFSRLCFEKSPTNAHVALTSIALPKNLIVVTENVDQLHQKTGLQPIFATIDNIQQKIDLETLKELDAIICIGLSKDDKGMLGWYKTHHPKGKIIAIDLNKPQYLGNEDVFIQADAQKLLPDLHMMLKNRVAIPKK